MSNQTHLEWTDSLIKGRIAEAIFEQMLHESDRLTVIPFGYEKRTPEIADRSRELINDESKTVIKNTPDFVVIDNKEHNVSLIEVKYRSNPTNEEILEIASRIYKTWKPANLFLAMPTGFYYDSVKKIVENNGIISPFGEHYIPKDKQALYLEILNRHINSN